jgi:pyrroline-5-carboxylate reductase
VDLEQWGIVGIGKLGSAIITQLGHSNSFIRFFHPDERKAKAYEEAYPGHKMILRDELVSLDFLILSLPSDQVIPFVQGLIESNLSLGNVTMVNMATTLSTADLSRRFPEVKWLGVKFMGHAADLRERGNGLFVTEPNEAHPLELERTIRFFTRLGQVVVDKEMVVEEVNKLATRIALKGAMDLERALLEGGYRQEYAARALLSIAPEIMRAYTNGTLGHFARKIVEQLEEEKKKNP